MPFSTSLAERDFPVVVANAVALAPVNATQLVALWDATLFLIEEDGVVPICPAPLPTEEDKAWLGKHLTPRLHTSPDGRFVALVHDFGRYGLVADLQEKRVTMALDKGAYRYEHTPFPAAFFFHKGRTLLIHATDWNRLDISDPSDGTLISAREPLPVTEGQAQPEHYSGFWQGQLCVSKDSRWVADDQWCWGPAGEVTTWNLTRWVEENVWESEDGETRHRLCQRLYLWNVPMAWVDSKHLAVWGLGDDDEDMSNGARIFNVSSGKETATFAGPGKNAFFGSDGRLFSVEEDGLYIWDTSTGELLGQIDGFKPKWQRGDLLIELKDNRVRSWNWRSAFD